MGATRGADVLSHVCGNPMHTFNGGRAGLCADLQLEEDASAIVRFQPGGEYFCQTTGGDHHVIPCAGAAWLIEWWHQLPGQPGFSLLGKSQTMTCGTFDGRPGTHSTGACPRARILLGLPGVRVHPIHDEPPCTRYFARAKASFQLPGDPTTIEGAVLDSEIWQDLPCPA
jgi:hypothetical protein